MVEPARGARRFLYWILAGFFLVLAMIGVILPGIPTTPFLLLMCFFLIRVSPTLHAKTLDWPVVGAPLRDWHDQGGVRRNVKTLAITMVVLLVGSTLIFSPLFFAIKLIIFVAAIYGVFIVLRLPTAKKDSGSQKLNPAAIEMPSSPIVLCESTGPPASSQICASYPHLTNSPADRPID